MFTCHVCCRPEICPVEVGVCHGLFCTITLVCVYSKMCVFHNLQDLNLICLLKVRRVSTLTMLSRVDVVLFEADYMSVQLLASIFRHML